MYYYEVLVADKRYHSNKPLTYCYSQYLEPGSVVTVPLQNRMITGFVTAKVKRPAFKTKSVKTVLSSTLLPAHCVDLAKWMSLYYGTSLSDSLRQFAPTKPTIRKSSADSPVLLKQQAATEQLEIPLTAGQKAAIKKINASLTRTVLLHGDTGSGKTRVYLELAEAVIKKGQSVIILTPEIALTSQLSAAVLQKLDQQAILIHSHLSAAERKKIWKRVLESTTPIVIIGPRSALFSPVSNLGLVIVDEAHEPAYKHEQAPRYNTLRVASKLGELTGAKVIAGSATPSIADYYLAYERDAVVEMKEQAVTGERAKVISELVDIKDRANFVSNPYLSESLIKAVRVTIGEGKQALIYFNRRGTARLMMCNVCGWQMLCLNCDIPLTYHADSHMALCHICGHKNLPPTSCPECSNPDVIFKSIGTKAVVEMVAKLFPNYNVKRFDSDNDAGERIDELYPDILSGKIDIVVGTQLLAKGFDLPRLGVVGIVSAETSLAIPDFTAEERAFQLLYQVIGRVGRGHGHGKVVIQSYDPENPLLLAAVNRDFSAFYQHAVAERRQYKFPPYSFLAKFICKRSTLKGAQNASENLKQMLIREALPVEIIGPAPSFYERRGNNYYWQLIIKSKDRSHLLALAQKVPTGWSIDIDPIDLL